MKNTDLIIFSGQSNMQGQTEALPEDNSPVSGAWEYRFCQDELIPLKHPVGEDIDKNGKLFTPDPKDLKGVLERSALLASWLGNANMVPAFCRSYVKTAGRNAVAVHAAKGSTVIDYWQKNKLGYEMLVKKARAAIEKVQPERIFFVWLQGESNALSSTGRKEYKDKLALLCLALKEELSMEKFGIILVGKFANDRRDAEIINAQKDICREHEDFIMLTTATETMVNEAEYMNPFVSGHYSCAGQEKLGLLAGTALGEYAKQKA